MVQQLATKCLSYITFLVQLSINNSIIITYNSSIIQGNDTLYSLAFADQEKTVLEAPIMLVTKYQERLSP